MDIINKLSILSDAAKYDASCSSSGSTRKNMPGGIGNAHQAGICHSYSDDGRCISLLKILLTNHCIYDCVYCVNRCSNDIPRAKFTPEEVADLTINFYKRNYIEGLFLSSAVIKSPDHTMELMLRAVRKLHEEYRFNGYIHLKAIPGADLKLIHAAGTYVDRMSVNIELPSEQSLMLLAPQKKKEAIFTPMGYIGNKLLESGHDRRKFKKAPDFVPAGQSTQLIIGATPDNDMKILRLSEGLYKRYSLKRVYYSAFVPAVSHPNLPAVTKPPLLREHRLYQADWLLRFYGFSATELLDEKHPDFDTRLDPKCDWALRNMHLFPVEINKANYETILRVPGIGVQSAQRIVAARRVGALSFEDLKKIGVVLKRAQFFITCKGKYSHGAGISEETVKLGLLLTEPKSLVRQYNWEQLSLFDNLPQENNIYAIDSTYTRIVSEAFEKSSAEQVTLALRAVNPVYQTIQG